MTAEKPPIAEFIISFDELDPVALCEAQLVGTPRVEIIYPSGIELLAPKSQVDPEMRLPPNEKGERRQEKPREKEGEQDSAVDDDGHSVLGSYGVGRMAGEASSGAKRPAWHEAGDLRITSKISPKSGLGFPDVPRPAAMDGEAILAQELFRGAVKTAWFVDVYSGRSVGWVEDAKKKEGGT